MDTGSIHGGSSIGKPTTTLPDDTVCDILDRMRGPELWILASHFANGDIDAIMGSLAARDWHLEQTHITIGAAVLHLTSRDVAPSREIRPGW